MKIRFFSIYVFSLLIVSGLYAQEGSTVNRKNIIEVLNSTDSATKATVRIHQDKRIDALMANKKAQSQQQANGFRIQIFSSNLRTAKTEAFKVEQTIRESYPDLAVYVNYTSPFWKVRVGDFKSKSEAQSLKNQLVDSFPTLKSEIYVVPEIINVSESN